MTPVLTLLFVLFLCAPVGAQDLPPAMLADQYLLEAAEAMEQGEPQKAARAFKKIEALEIEPPPTFAYFYGKLLAEHGVGPEVWRKGQALLKQFVLSVGRDSEYYTPTLKLLSMVEAKLRAEAAHQSILVQVNAQMVRVEGGIFTMGCTREREWCSMFEEGFFGIAEPAHQVAVSSFEISKYEVTQELWVAVMGENPSHFQDCPQCPVEQVSWEDVQAFLRQLNTGGGRYRLPSEAEWEYAARGGEQSRGYEYAGSDTPDAVGWHAMNSGGRTHPVGQKQANELGLYDLSGNVDEWVQDCWNNNYVGAPSDGRAWESGDCRYRVHRGGAVSHAAGALRPANNRGWRSGWGFYIGFRIARSLP